MKSVICQHCENVILFPEEYLSMTDVQALLASAGVKPQSWPPKLETKSRTTRQGDSETTVQTQDNVVTKITHTSPTAPWYQPPPTIEGGVIRGLTIVPPVVPTITTGGNWKYSVHVEDMGDPGDAQGDG